MVKLRSTIFSLNVIGILINVSDSTHSCEFSISVVACQQEKRHIIFFYIHCSLMESSGHSS